MMDERLYRETFSRLRASDEAKKEVLVKMNETKKMRRPWKALRAVALAFSITGETGEVVRIVKEYVENGVCVIALTGRTGSSLARLANFIFFTPSQVIDRKYGRWLDGMMSQLFVVEALVEEINKLKYTKETED